MGHPLASVIVPIYNTAQWLPEALASLREQGRGDEIEVILVDDGSTDDSTRIARDHAEQTEGVSYVRQANAGLGAARNHGLRLATGRFVGFLDSDDLYPLGGLDRLLDAAERHDAKIAIGDLHGLPPRPSPPWRRELVEHPYERVVESIGMAPDLIGNPSPCNKVFARDFVADRNARFTEDTAFEDVLFTTPLMLRSDRTAITPKLAYLYRQRGNGTSIMESRSQPTKIMQHLTAVERLMELSRNADERSRRAVARWVAYMQLHYAGRAAEALDDDLFKEFCDRMAVLFQDIPVDAVREYAHGVKAALRGVAIYQNDVTGVRQAYSRTELRVADGTVYAGDADIGRYRSLLALDPVTAELTALRSADGQLELDVRCTVPQLRVASGETRKDLTIEVGHRSMALTSTAEWTTDLRLRCLLDPRDHGDGRHRVRFVVRDHDASVVRPSGLRGRTRPVVLPDGSRAWLAGNRHGVQLTISSTQSLWDRLGWTVVGSAERAVAKTRARTYALARRVVRYARRALVHLLRGVQR